MRALLLMRGAAGCGKSTFIENNHLKPYTLSSDDIRMQCASPVLDINGNPQIDASHDKVVWDMLFQMLEIRMQNGDFTVIDATNSKTSEMNQYKELANKYRYRLYIVDMTDVPIEETKRRNMERPPLKRVPEEAIDKHYARFATQGIPAGIKVLKPDELYTIWYRKSDLNQYRRIHVFGDIHGCYTVLMQYFAQNGGIKDDECYIFTGDYVDRGIENAEVVQFIIDNIKRPNFIFLEGNHERWLWSWSNDEISKSKEFEFHTKPQLNKAGIKKKDVREAYRRFGQCCYFTHGGLDFLICHGGISDIPDNLLLVPTRQLIHGVGRYPDVDAVDQAFDRNTDIGTYQIHAHRNTAGTDIRSTGTTFNLCGQVEFGGALRVAQICEDGIHTVELKNPVFKQPEVIAQEQVDMSNVNQSVYDIVTKMRSDRNIYEKSFGRISSFNFTKQAFANKAWSDIVNKARGLYIDTKDYNVVGRAYEKFFNLNERPETKLDALQHSLKFPVSAYVKENGFLGIIGWNPEVDDLLIASKSTIEGEYTAYFRQALEDVYGQSVMDGIRDYIKEHNVSFVFECCDPINDPHIIRYARPHVVLLDVVKNQIQYEHIPYHELRDLAETLRLEVKKEAKRLENWAEFYEWYQQVTAEDYLYLGKHIEGFVLEDSSGFMFKLKLYYYNFWKHMRSVAQSVLAYGQYRYTGSLTSVMANEFYGFCKKKAESLSPTERQQLKQKSFNNICTLRDEFFKWKETNHAEEIPSV